MVEAKSDSDNCETLITTDANSVKSERFETPVSDGLDLLSEVSSKVCIYDVQHIQDDKNDTPQVGVDEQPVQCLESLNPNHDEPETPKEPLEFEISLTEKSTPTEPISKPQKIENQTQLLAQEFASLLQKLTSTKITLFAEYLSKQFSKPYGISIEISVLDIPEETWELLRSLSCTK